MPLVATAQEAAGREPEVLCRFAFETRLIRRRGCCREPHQPGQGLLRSVNDNIVRFVESQFQQTLRGPPLRSGSSSSDWRGDIKARETAELKARMADLVGQLPPCILYLTRSAPWIRPLTVRFDAGAPSCFSWSVQGTCWLHNIAESCKAGRPMRRPAPVTNLIQNRDRYMGCSNLCSR